MNDITIIGIDLAKHVFQLHAEDSEGNVVFTKRLKRKAFKETLIQLKPCLIGMEACATAHHWGRVCLELGHQVKLINPRRVKAFLGANKNDARDAEAICEATRSKKVRAVAVKTLTQQDLSSLHKARSQIVSRRTQLTNHIRSQLSEYGVITSNSKAALMRLVQEVLAGEHLDMSEIVCFAVTDCYNEVLELDKRIKAYDRMINKVIDENKSARTLMDMPGIGPLSATAIVAKVDNFNEFDSGRNFSAWLGLTPREHSSGQRHKMGKISKQGDRYLRTLLIHGARAVMLSVKRGNKPDTAYYRWVKKTMERLDWNKAAVALANKHARMIWAMMYHNRGFDLQFADKHFRQAA